MWGDVSGGSRLTAAPAATGCLPWLLCLHMYAVHLVDLSGCCDLQSLVPDFVLHLWSWGETCHCTPLPCCFLRPTSRRWGDGVEVELCGAVGCPRVVLVRGIGQEGLGAVDVRAKISLDMQDSHRVTVATLGMTACWLRGIVRCPWGDAEDDRAVQAPRFCSWWVRWAYCGR